MAIEVNRRYLLVTGNASLVTFWSLIQANAFLQEIEWHRAAVQDFVAEC
jgi:hypothetical protein